jgi:hypothetical protein
VGGLGYLGAGFGDGSLWHFNLGWDDANMGDTCFRLWLVGFLGVGGLWTCVWGLWGGGVVVLCVGIAKKII